MDKVIILKREDLSPMYSKVKLREINWFMFKDLGKDEVDGAKYIRFKDDEGYKVLKDRFYTKLPSVMVFYSEGFSEMDICKDMIVLSIIKMNHHSQLKGIVKMIYLFAIRFFEDLDVDEEVNGLKQYLDWNCNNYKY